MPLCYPQQLAGRFSAVGINAHSNAWAGMGASVTTAPNRNYNDARLSIGSDFSFFSSATPTLGGCYLTATANTSHPLAFTPVGNVDTFKIFSNNTGVSQANLNGGSNSTLSGSTSTVAGTLGANTLNLSWSSGGAIFTTGIEAYDSSKSWVSVVNAGWQGSRAGDQAVAGTQLGINTLVPSLTLINIGINDWTGGTSVSSFTTSLQTLITYAKATGDCVIITPNPSNTTSASTVTQQALINVMYSLAASNNVTLIDLWGRWQSYSVSNGLGLAYDNLHPNGAGYSDVAQFIANVIATP